MRTQLGSVQPRSEAKTERRGRNTECVQPHLKRPTHKLLATCMPQQFPPYTSPLDGPFSTGLDVRRHSPDVHAQPIQSPCISPYSLLSRPRRQPLCCTSRPGTATSNSHFLCPFEPGSWGYLGACPSCPPHSQVQLPYYYNFELQLEVQTWKTAPQLRNCGVCSRAKSSIYPHHPWMRPQSPIPAQRSPCSALYWASAALALCHMGRRARRMAEYALTRLSRLCNKAPLSLSSQANLRPCAHKHALKCAINDVTSAALQRSRCLGTRRQQP